MFSQQGSPPGVAPNAVETCAELGAPVFVLGTGSLPRRMQPERHPSKPQPVPIDVRVEVGDHVNGGSTVLAALSVPTDRHEGGSE